MKRRVFKDNGNVNFHIFHQNNWYKNTYVVFRWYQSIRNVRFLIRFTFQAFKVAFCLYYTYVEFRNNRYARIIIYWFMFILIAKRYYHEMYILTPKYTWRGNLDRGIYLL